MRMATEERINNMRRTASSSPILRRRSGTNLHNYYYNYYNHPAAGSPTQQRNVISNSSRFGAFLHHSSSASVSSNNNCNGSVCSINSNGTSNSIHTNNNGSSRFRKRSKSPSIELATTDATTIHTWIRLAISCVLLVWIGIVTYSNAFLKDKYISDIYYYNQHDHYQYKQQRSLEEPIVTKTRFALQDTTRIFNKTVHYFHNINNSNKTIDDIIHNIAKISYFKSNNNLIEQLPILDDDIIAAGKSSDLGGLLRTVHYDVDYFYEEEKRSQLNVMDRNVIIKNNNNDNDDDCISLWNQQYNHPTCNIVHEIDNINLIIEQHQQQQHTLGNSSLLWEVSNTPITIKIQTNTLIEDSKSSDYFFEERIINSIQQEAILMDRLATSIDANNNKKHNLFSNIYGHCATSLLLQSGQHVTDSIRMNMMMSLQQQQQQQENNNAKVIHSDFLTSNDKLDIAITMAETINDVNTNNNNNNKDYNYFNIMKVHDLQFDQILLDDIDQLFIIPTSDTFHIQTRKHCNNNDDNNQDNNNKDERNDIQSMQSLLQLILSSEALLENHDERSREEKNINDDDVTKNYILERNIYQSIEEANNINDVIHRLHEIRNNKNIQQQNDNSKRSSDNNNNNIQIVNEKLFNHDNNKRPLEEENNEEKKKNLRKSTIAT